MFENSKRGEGNYKKDFSAGPESKNISKANIYHTGSQRSNNLEFDLAKGVTVEFWLKKDGWAKLLAYKPKHYSTTMRQVQPNLQLMATTGLLELILMAPILI